MRLEAAAKDNKGKKKDATADMEREMQDKATKKAYGAMTDEELKVSARCARCPLPPPQVVRRAATAIGRASGLCPLMRFGA